MAKVEIDGENTLHKVQEWEQAYGVQWPQPFVIPFLHDRQYLTQLREPVETAVDKGHTVTEALAVCASMSYRIPNENRQPHERNVRFVYDELSGR